MTVSNETGGETPVREIALPERLDVAICEYLSEELKAAQGQPLTLNAQGVHFLGSMVLQLLISAMRQWQADGHAFRVVAPSEAFRSAMALMGYPRSPFEDEVPA